MLYCRRDPGQLTACRGKSEGKNLDRRTHSTGNQGNGCNHPLPTWPSLFCVCTQTLISVPIHCLHPTYTRRLAGFLLSLTDIMRHELCLCLHVALAQKIPLNNPLCRGLPSRFSGTGKQSAYLLPPSWTSWGVPEDGVGRHSPVQPMCRESAVHHFLGNAKQTLVTFICTFIKHIKILTPYNRPCSLM